MNAAERELMLLCSRFERGTVPLQTAQYTALLQKLQVQPGMISDHTALSEAERERISAMLARTEALDALLSLCGAQGIAVITRLNPAYPQRVLARLKDDSPVVLFCRGNTELLNTPGIAVVGSRDLREENAVFAENMGTYAACNGLVLISGDARGADKTAQIAAVQAGGSVVAFVSDSLLSRKPHPRVCFVSEDGPDHHFTTLRALSRNRLIHAAGLAVFVAQTGDGTGGSWSGSLKNLKNRWSPVYVYEDGSEAAKHLIQEGALPASKWAGARNEED